MSNPTSLLTIDEKTDFACRGGNLRTRVKRDPVEAVQQGRRTGEKHRGEALFALGMDYEYGVGVANDEHKAIRCYRKAAKKGSVSAAFTLGIKYEYGLGVLKDEQEGVRWYRKAAEEGHVASQFILGVKYEYGWDVKKDARQAEQWYRKAAEQGNADAMAKLNAQIGETHPGQNQKQVKSSTLAQASRQNIPRSTHQVRSPLMFLKNLGMVCRMLIS